MPLEISASDEGKATLLLMNGTVVGPADRESFQLRIQEVLEGSNPNLILDMGGVTYVDSAGIGALVATSNLAMRKGGCIKLLHLTKRIHDVLQITRLSSVFGIYDSLQKALDSFDSQG